MHKSMAMSADKNPPRDRFAIFAIPCHETFKRDPSNNPYVFVYRLHGYGPDVASILSRYQQIIQNFQLIGDM